MPFSRPTLTQLRQQVAADIEADLPGSGGLLRYSNLGIMGNVQAAGLAGLYGYLDWIARMGVPFTAEDEYLLGWAALKGVLQKAGSKATGVALFDGTNGSVVPDGTPLSRADGVGFITVGDAEVAMGSVSVSIVATEVGAAANGLEGAAVTLGIGIAGVSSTGQISLALSGGADIESLDSIRTRMLKAYASPPQGGALSDYEQWALDVPGVTRAWARGNLMGSGSVTVYFMMDDTEAAHGGFPQGVNGVAAAEARDVAASGDQLLVADAIFPLRPVTALVYAVAPQPNVLDFTISGIQGATTATKGAIQAAIASALLFNAIPGGTTSISTIELAIASIPGAAGFVITAIASSAGTVLPGAAGNIVSSAGHLPVLGTVTWSA